MAAALRTFLAPSSSFSVTYPPRCRQAIARLLASNSTGSVISVKTVAHPNNNTPTRAEMHPLPFAPRQGKSEHNHNHRGMPPVPPNPSRSKPRRVRFGVLDRVTNPVAATPNAAMLLESCTDWLRRRSWFVGHNGHSILRVLALCSHLECCCPVKYYGQCLHR